MATNYVLTPTRALGAVDASGSFDYAATALGLARSSIAQIGSFQPYAVIALEKNGANPRVIPFQSLDDARAAYKNEADTLSSNKAYAGLFDGDGAIEERNYGWIAVVDGAIAKLKPLALPILVVGGLVAAAVAYARVSHHPAARKRTRRPSKFRRRTTTTWRAR